MDGLTFADITQEKFSQRMLLPQTGEYGCDAASLPPCEKYVRVNKLESSYLFRPKRNTQKDKTHWSKVILFFQSVTATEFTSEKLRIEFAQRNKNKKKKKKNPQNKDTGTLVFKSVFIL